MLSDSRRVKWFAKRYSGVKQFVLSDSRRVKRFAKRDPGVKQFVLTLYQPMADNAVMTFVNSP